MNALGLIFSNLHEDALREITMNRTMASVPFGGRYRIIDFVLSNMTNAGIKTVGVITKTNYQSLMDHVGSGKEWDLARKNGGLHFLPPYGVTSSSFVYSGKLQALKSVTGFLNKTSEKYVVLSDCDTVASVDLSKVLDFHKEKNADVTMVYTTAMLDGESSKSSVVLDVDFEDRITGLSSGENEEGFHKVSMNLWVMEKSYLLSLIDSASAMGVKHIENEFFLPKINQIRLFAYRFRGYSAKIDSMKNYYAKNMELLERKVRKELFGNGKIYTKIKDAPPTYYGDVCEVSESIIADGCVIEGTVRNSVLFRGVKVDRGAVVENSIIMQDSTIGTGTRLNAVILDKNVTIRDSRNLAGHETYPLYVSKGKTI